MFRQLLFYFEMVMSAIRELESSDSWSIKTSAALSTGSQKRSFSTAAIFVLNGGEIDAAVRLVSTNIESLLNRSYFDMMQPCLITLDASLHFVMPRLSHVVCGWRGGGCQ